MSRRLQHWRLKDCACEWYPTEIRAEMDPPYLEFLLFGSAMSVTLKCYWEFLRPGNHNDWYKIIWLPQWTCAARYTWSHLRKWSWSRNKGALEYSIISLAEATKIMRFTYSCQNNTIAKPPEGWHTCQDIAPKGNQEIESYQMRISSSVTPDGLSCDILVLEKTEVRKGKVKLSR